VHRYFAGEKFNLFSNKPGRDLDLSEPGDFMMNRQLQDSGSKIIDDTPQRWAALLEIYKQYEAMRMRVEELLAGDNVESVLETLSLKLIEAPREGAHD